MSAPPPLPARPAELAPPQRQDSAPPPIPPLPPNFQGPQASFDRSKSPMIAPRPQKSFQDAPANMAQSLESQSFDGRFPMPMPIPGNAYRGPSPAPPQFTSSSSANLTRPISTYPDFNAGQGYQSPPPFASSGQASSYPSLSSVLDNAPRQPPLNQPPLQPNSNGISLNTAFARMNVADSYASPPSAGPSRDYDVTAPAVFRPELIPFAPIIPRPAPGQPPILTTSLPTADSLTAAALSVANQDNPARKLGWSKQVLNLVERTINLEQALNFASTSESITQCISTPKLIALTDQAIPQIIAICDTAQAPYAPFQAEAFYLRGNLSASGLFPQFLPRDLRSSFKDYEIAARNGHDIGWFKIGRDYEGVHDLRRAKDSFDRGVRLGEKNCLYRMGMAYLQGQLELPRNPELAIPLLKQSADNADVESPQAAYVFGMILLGEFSHIEIPSLALARYLPRPSGDISDPRMHEAKRYIERAAYLCYGPAQVKAGWAHEFAKMGCAYDPLLSVQYYSLASQQGEEEADMALSKWFLCGAEGYFEKEEYLAYTFAEKAARKGLPTAEFAMGYYNEVGIGRKKDLDVAQKWYEKAASHGNADAMARVQALSLSRPATLSRAEHETITSNKLVRKRTQAKDASAALGRRPTKTDGRHAAQVAQTAVDASSRIMPPARSDGPSPAPFQRPISVSASSPQSAGGPPQRVHHFGRKSKDFNNPNSRAGTSSSPPRASPAPTPIRAPISLDDPPVARINTQPPQAQPRPTSPPAPAAAAAAAAASSGTSPPKKGPTTFAEMGYHSQPLDDKECKIM